MQINGKLVDDATNEPIVGAIIRIKSTDKVVGQTTAEGTFNIEVPANQLLSFEMIGYQESVVRYGQNQKNLVLRLSSDQIEIEDVVVTGYQSERKKDITGAVTVVKLDDINQQSTGNAMKSLQGKLPGVSITSNGSPRGAATVRIRGVGTLNDNNPLYIIDGVPTKTGLHAINQLDIESMQVLKDASAASIYGSRAANGVIIITTKKGKSGQTSVDFNSYLASSKYVNKLKMLNTQQYGEILFKANAAANTDPNAVNLPFTFTYRTEDGRRILEKMEVNEFLDPNQTMRTANTDWFDEITKTGVTQNYDVNVSRGTSTGSSLFSLGHFNNSGIVKESSFSRTSLRFNSEYRLFDDLLKIGENFNVAYLDEGGTVPINQAIQAVPMIPVRTVDGQGWGGPWGAMNDRQNPVRLIEDNKHNRNHYVRMLGNLFADITIYKNLVFKTNYGIDYGQDYIRNWEKAYKSGYLVGPLNKVTMRQWHDLKTNWANTLSYNKVFNELHQVDVLAGMELFKSRYSTFNATREDYVNTSPEFMYLDAGTGLKDNSGSGQRFSLLSYFGKINYSFNDRYLASFTVRHDGSSRFGQNNRFGTFPAFSLGWRLSEESFIKDWNVFNDLKIRYGWGVTGNQEISNHAIFDVYSVNYATTSYDLEGVGTGTLPSGYVQTQTGNNNLKWESTTQSNIGLDFALNQQTLFGSIDYYTKHTKDILLNPSWLAVIGEGGSRWLNGASLQNKGVEILLGNRMQINKDLVVNTSLSFDIVRNKVTYLPDAVVNSYGGDARIGVNILGRPLNSFYGYVADGLFKSVEEVDSHAAQPGKGLGRIRFKDLNGDGVINDYDRTWIGVPMPDFSYGFNLGLNYKKLDFSVFIQGISGIDVHNEIKVWTDFWSVTNIYSNKGARLYDAWSIDNPESDIPAIANTNPNNEGRLSSYLIENGSYMKLRNVQLGYTFLNDMKKGNLKFKSIRLYLNLDNAGIIYKNKSYTGLDPESPAFGYPNPFVFTGGINIKF